jgi:hypothetical protein
VRFGTPDNALHALARDTDGLVFQLHKLFIIRSKSDGPRISRLVQEPTDLFLASECMKLQVYLDLKSGKLRQVGEVLIMRGFVTYTVNQILLG